MAGPGPYSPEDEFRLATDPHDGGRPGRRIRLGAGRRRALSEREELLCVLSHEFRTPLTVISGYLRLLYEDLCSDGDAAMAKVCALLGVEERPLCRPTVYPEKDHVLGNVTRFAFDGQIRPSLKWMEAVSAADQQEILRVTKPLSEELGYV